MPVICGNPARHTDRIPAAHASVDAVRACILASETWPCDWVIRRLNTRDGDSYADYGAGPGKQATLFPQGPS